MPSYTLSPIGGAGAQFFDNNGNPLSGGKLYTYAAGTTTPLATYTTPTGSTPNSNPIVLDAAGRPPQEIWLSQASTYKFVLKTSADVLLATYDNIPGLPPPAIFNDASGISYEQGYTVSAGSFVVGQTYMIATVGTTDFTAIGAVYNSAGTIFTATGVGLGTGTAYVSQTVEAKLRQSVSAVDFGVDKTGATNTTAAFKAFFDYCIATGVPGNIPAGTYLVTAGVLAFDNGHTDKLWPQITTDGYGAVTFKRSDATDAAMISITNGTASSGAGRFWRGGCLGGITFDQNGKATASGQHGLILRGVVGTNFGYMRANDIGGSCIYIERKLYAVNNPDPYNVSACVFEAAEANRCKGAAFYNDNYVGLTGNTIRYIRAILNENGAFFGMGASNSIEKMSVGSCAGWAIGDNVNGLGGSSSRFVLGAAEFDDVQYGINIQRVTASDFGIVRFVHRYNFSSLNPAGGYWPRICIQASALYGSNGLRMQIVDRIEAGGAKVDLGQLFDMANAGGNLVNITVQRSIIDNAGFGFTPTDYYTNFNSNSTIYYTQSQGNIILDTLGKSAAVARAPTTFAVPNGGFGGAANVVQFSTIPFDPSASYDATTYTYTCRAFGLYSISARITLALPIGTRLRMAVQLAASIDTAVYFYSTTANAQCYELNTCLVLAAGATIKINADQNSGAPVNLTVNVSANENQLVITQL